jgi:hypothetical protein
MTIDRHIHSVVIAGRQRLPECKEAHSYPPGAVSSRLLMRDVHCLCLLIACFFLLTGCGGCRRSTTTQQSKGASSAIAAAQYRDEMLLYAIDNLNRLEDFDSADALRELLQRFDPQNMEKPDKADRRVDPLLAAWPQPEMFHQVVDRFNQWVRAQHPPADWKLDPMTAALPRPLDELPEVKNLAKMVFSPFDGFALQEAAWLHDISLWAKGDGLDDLDRAQSLFDWTIRNVQLDVDHPNRIPQFPRETLLFGHGTASERAWLFILLLRQLDIDAALLAIDEGGEGLGTSVPSKSAPSKPESRKSDPNKTASTQPAKPPDKTPAKRQPTRPLRPWCVGVLIDGQVYLFDTVSGVPIPAPNGVKLDEAGRLAIRPATLAQVVADDKLLRRMDYDESHVYAVRSSDLQGVTALLEASPPYLARPMKAIQSQLSGQRKIVLSTSPSEQAKHWKPAGVDDCRLWLLPYSTLALRSRIDWRVYKMWLTDVLPLYLVYEEKEKQSPRVRAASKDPLEVEDSQGPRAAQTVAHAAPLYKGRVLYLKGKFTGDEGAIHYLQIARPSLRSLAMSSADEGEKQVKLCAKQDASYWLGLTMYQRGNYPAAIEYFMKYSIEAYPNGPWTPGARYNLARTYEAKGETMRAILLYGSNSAYSGCEGDLLRAKWLRELSEKGKP